VHSDHLGTLLDRFVHVGQDNPGSLLGTIGKQGQLVVVIILETGFGLFNSLIIGIIPIKIDIIVGGKIMITPCYDRILLGRTGTGNDQDNYRYGSTENLIQYSDIRLILINNFNNAKLFYTWTKTLSFQNISILGL
jgi:hypothetical protein